MKYLFLFFILFILVYNTSSYQYVKLDTKDVVINYEIKGHIKKPGIYNCKNCTIKEAIDASGGLLDDADISKLNLTKKIYNEDVIIIDAISKKVCVSLNSASVEELDNLKGIGISTANKIIKYRSENSFNTIEDIMNVKGIKEKIFNNIKNDICL